MNRIEIQDGAIQIDADFVGQGLGLDAAALQAMIRVGEVTSLCEQGREEDAGRYRLTFFHRSRRFRIVVDEVGRVLQRSTIEFGERPLPAAMRRKG